MDIHGKSVDMDMDGKFHIHGACCFDTVPRCDGRTDVGLGRTDVRTDRRIDRRLRWLKP